MNNSAASGGSTTMPASAAIFALTPMNTIAAVSSARGTCVATPRRAAATNPLPSATPIPIMVTSTSPSGANPVKLCTASVNMRCTFAGVSRLTARIGVPSLGCGTCTPSAAAIAETITTIRHSTANSVIGSGSRLPSRST